MSRGYPSLTALLGLLAIAGYQNRDKIAEMLGRSGQSKPEAPGQGGSGGFLEQLTKVWAAPAPAASSAVGWANSWSVSSRVARGAPRTLGSRQARTSRARRPSLSRRWALVLDDLSKQTGLSREELVSRLCRELPDAVDKYTPEGRLPTEADFSRA